MPTFLRYILIASSVYVITLIGVYYFQRSLMYLPPDRVYRTPRDAHADPALKEFPVQTADGLSLKGWYASATSEPLTLVFFHGNGDALTTVDGIASFYAAAGYGFLATEYRGYSGMPGTPTEEGLYNDGRAYLSSLIASGVKEEDIVLFGFSLGSGVATQLATEFHVRALMLLAPYLSVPKVAQVHFRIFPAERLTLDRFDNEKKIGDVHIPVLVVNGAKDLVIPPSQGKDLFALANESKTAFFLDHGSHVDMFQHGFGELSLNWLKSIANKNIANH